MPSTFSKFNPWDPDIKYKFIYFTSGFIYSNFYQLGITRLVLIIAIRIWFNNLIFVDWFLSYQSDKTWNISIWSKNGVSLEAILHEIGIWNWFAWDIQSGFCKPGFTVS